MLLDTGSCDNCTLIDFLLSLPSRPDGQTVTPPLMNAATFAAALWSTAPIVRTAVHI